MVINPALLDHFIPKPLNVYNFDPSHDLGTKHSIDCGNIFSGTVCLGMAICDIQNSEG